MVGRWVSFWDCLFLGGYLKFPGFISCSQKTKLWNEMKPIDRTSWNPPGPKIPKHPQANLPPTLPVVFRGFGETGQKHLAFGTFSLLPKFARSWLVSNDATSDPWNSENCESDYLADWRYGVVDTCNCPVIGDWDCGTIQMTSTNSVTPK